MARWILDGRVAATTRSELEAIVTGLACIRDLDVAQEAFGRLAAMPISQAATGGRMVKMSGEEVERAIRSTLDQCAPPSPLRPRS